MSVPYAYPTPNSVLIRALNLQKYPEAGYLVQTVGVETLPPVITTKTVGLPLPPSRVLDGRVLSEWGPGCPILGGTEKHENEGVAGAKLEATGDHYLLTPDSHQSKLHMNLHAVSHRSFLVYSALTGIAFPFAPRWSSSLH
jgi:hypothetical protein